MIDGDDTGYSAYIEDDFDPDVDFIPLIHAFEDAATADMKPLEKRELMESLLTEMFQEVAQAMTVSGDKGLAMTEIYLSFCHLPFSTCLTSTAQTNIFDAFGSHENQHAVRLYDKLGAHAEALTELLRTTDLGEHKLKIH